MVARRGRDSGHKVAGDEGSDDHGASTGRLFLLGVSVKVQRGQNDRHLTDLPRVAWRLGGQEVKIKSDEFTQCKAFL